MSFSKPVFAELYGGRISNVPTPMDVDLVPRFEESSKSALRDGIQAVNAASIEHQVDLWQKLKIDPDAHLLSDESRALYARLFEENENKGVMFWNGPLGQYKEQPWTFQLRYPTFNVWAESQKGGFMFSRDQSFDLIGKHMKEGHSGRSYAWTMRQLQYIAQNGFDSYVTMVANYEESEKGKKINELLKQMENENADVEALAIQISKTARGQ